MYTVESIIQIGITLLVATAITYLIFKNSAISGTKIMLSGIGLMVFMGSEVGEHIRNANEIFTVIGFGVVIAGLFKKN